MVLAAVLVSSATPWCAISSITAPMPGSSCSGTYTRAFLIGAGYTLLRNEHVRIDIINSRLSPRTRAWIDLLGGIFFLLPMALLIMTLAWPVFTASYALHETSPSANGLLRWPVKLMIPVGFFLLALQGVSEIIKRAAFLLDLIPDPTPRHRHGADDVAPHDLVQADER
jgi:TRAP-type mannitol/chloroaromatic compound transport system permease small subunit